MLNRECYDLTQNLQGAIFQSGMKKMDAPFPTPPPIVQLRCGYAESPAWFMAQAAEFDTEPLSVERLRVRAVWSSERIVRAILDLMASEMWFDRAGEDYYLTEEGRAIMQRIVERPREVLTPLIPLLAADDVERMESLLRRVIDASLNKR